MRCFGGQVRHVSRYANRAICRRLASSAEEAQLSAILFRQLQEVLAQYCWRDLFEFLEIDQAVTIRISLFRQHVALLIVYPSEPELLKSGLKLLLVNLAAAVSIGRLEEPLQREFA